MSATHFRGIQPPALSSGPDLGWRASGKSIMGEGKKSWPNLSSKARGYPTSPFSPPDKSVPSCLGGSPHGTQELLVHAQASKEA